MKLIKTIAVVGGGTSGWLSAAYLSRQFPDMKIILIDKQKGTPVGVGEGTLLNFQKFMESCGLARYEWFNEIQSVNKAGILFPKFKSDNHEIWHPFDFKGSFDDWSRRQSASFKHEVLSLYETSVREKQVVESKINSYALHVDCTLLALYIKLKLKNKILFIDSEVKNIERDENNYITQLNLLDGTKVNADLYLDCTGFKALLNNNKKRESLKKRLICDTAIACHVQYQDIAREQNPYVNSEAVSCGWVWNIPTQSRIGTGLVFNRSITRPEDALDKFREYWSDRVDPAKCRMIDWTPYYDKNFWHQNVVQIGLSAGFVEPLESTGVALIMEGIYHFASRIEKLYYTERDPQMYNHVMNMFFEESVDFINMHYVKNEKDTPFWNNANELEMSDRQKLMIEVLKDPNISLDIIGSSNTFQKYNFFSTFNWLVWMIQMGYDVAPRNFRLKEKQWL